MLTLPPHLLAKPNLVCASHCPGLALRKPSGARKERSLGDSVSVFGGGPPQENGKVHNKYTALEPLAVESAASRCC